MALLASCNCGTTTTTLRVADQFEVEKYDDRLNLFIVADGGRNGYYEQQNVADQMGNLSEVVEPEVVISAGDTHHFEGIQSVGDPLWVSNFEDIYTHPELMVSWLPVLGNHEYRGNTQAVLDYANVSRRWVMPDRYYTTVLDEAGTTVRLVMIDTAPLIDKYRNDSAKYPDAVKQDMDTQLQGIDSVLRCPKWKKRSALFWI